MARIRGLSKTYQMGSEIIHALRDISLSVEEGEYLAITGPSGSGKSTLMHMMGCLDSPSAGNYWIRNKEISTWKESELAKIRNQDIGFVFQFFNLLPRFTALENVALPLIYSGRPRKERIERGTHILSTVGLADRIHHKPSQLSGGQQQRVAIARALINQPALVLADEPTGNLDSQSSEEVMGLFKELQNKGHTLIIVTHDKQIAEQTNRIIRLKDGEIISDTPTQK
ncbi:MAG: ABC transporter ATP-binding protein [Cytophagales bacterium]|nr:ABC transporter ATP-binding protein [Cytophagales bacterium]